jgi:hypothetical protein
MYKIELEYYMLQYISMEKNYVSDDCGSFKSANHKKDWVRKSQIRKVPHSQKVCKSNKLFIVRVRLQIFGFTSGGTYLRTVHI